MTGGDVPAPSDALQPLEWEVHSGSAAAGRWPHKVLHELAADFDGVRRAHLALTALLSEIAEDDALPDETVRVLKAADRDAVGRADSVEQLGLLKRENLDGGLRALKQATEQRLAALRILRDLRKLRRFVGHLDTERTVREVNACRHHLAEAGRALARADRETLRSLAERATQVQTCTEAQERARGTTGRRNSVDLQRAGVSPGRALGLSL